MGTKDNIQTHPRKVVGNIPPDKVKNSKVTSILCYLGLVIAALSSIPMAKAQQVILNAAQAEIETPLVYTSTSVTLQLFRRNTGPGWQVDQCFQFFVGSPYSDPSVYQTFSEYNPPVCVSQTPGVVVGSCTVGASDSLNIVLSEVAETTKDEQSITIRLTNFNTPFSAQILRTLDIRSFADKYCTTSMKAKSLPSVNIQPRILPAEFVSLTSNSKVLGETSSNTTLKIAFTPQTTMAPNGKGSIELQIPEWYEVGTSGEYMYNPTAENKCKSSCMHIYESKLVNGRIQIMYEQMTQACIRNTKIVIDCRAFYNPIAPKVWGGFNLYIYDGEVDQEPIQITNNDLTFDATNFSPAIIPISNFGIDPANSMIATYSTWTITVDVNIPLEKECYLRFFVPPEFIYNPIDMQASGIFLKEDLHPTIELKDIDVIYRTKDGSIPKSSVVFRGCWEESSLGENPYGRIDITEIQTQKNVKDSDNFELTIYKDKELTQVIAVLADGAILSAKRVQPGSLTDLVISPTDYRVQHVNNIQISYTIENELQSQAGNLVELPAGLHIPDVNGKPATTITVQLMDNSEVKATITNDGHILIPSIVPAGQTYPGGSVIFYIIKGIKNQDSAKDAGEFTVTTLNYIDGEYYTVDTKTEPTSFTAIPGKISNVGPIVIKNAQNSMKYAQYNLKFITEDSLPMSGYVLVKFPPEIILNPANTLSSGSCKKYFCSEVTENSVKFLILEGLKPLTEYTLEIGGATNPRTFKPTGKFKITTLDIHGVTPIDIGFEIPTAMTIPGDMPNFSVEQSSRVNGEIVTMTFTSGIQIPIKPGDRLILQLPPEVGAPAREKLVCTPITNVVNITCSVSGDIISVTFNKLQKYDDPFTFSISGLRNPYSTAPSQPFIQVNFVDADNGFTVSQPRNGFPVVKNNKAAMIEVFSLTQADLTTDTVTEYTIEFVPVNPIPPSGSILIQYPSQVQVEINTKCTLITSRGTLTDRCSINLADRSIVIKGMFTSDYKGAITLILDKVRNPVTNRPGNGFQIHTYSDPQQVYIQDKIPEFQMNPSFLCDFPCLSCSPDSRSVCTSCWQDTQDFTHLMVYPTGLATCRPFCDVGYTTNGNPLLHCEPCDESCHSCLDNNEVGDAKECLECSETHQMRISQTRTCLRECELGMFASTETTCGFCKEPCKGCSGSELTCTMCFEDSPIPQLFYSQCIDLCPTGYISLNGVCTKCASPCAECFDSVENCLTCDGSGGTKFVYQDRCWADCPAGSGPDAENLTCFPCEQGCDLCDIEDKSICLKCTRPTVAYEGVCYPECPAGFSPNSPEGDGRSCRPWKLGDWGLVYFPFLMIALIFSLIAAFGETKKRFKINKNTGTMMSITPQNTIAVLVVVLAPIQFLAIIAQWVASFFYGAHTFCICAIVVTVAFVILNCVYQSIFMRSFDSKVIPLDIDRRVRLGKMTKREASKYKVPIDLKFHGYKGQHRKFLCVVYWLSVTFAWKCNKVFYSHFYDLNMFQVPLSRAKFYRKMVTIFQIVHMIVIDLFLICLDITALTQIEPWNMMWVFVIETLVLSILGIILGVVELMYLKSYLEYTEPKKRKDQYVLASDISAFDDDKDLNKKFNKQSMSQRVLLMTGVLKNVKNFKHTFLNNKLDELLEDFGSRKCKSMMDLSTGWSLEDDPRLVITWPSSPGLAQDYEDLGLLQPFTKIDAYGVQGNNVYADVSSKFMKMDFATMADDGWLEFQDALNRKHAGLMGQDEGDIEERRMKRKNRRRGRKNKYYAQIDIEDDQEARVVEDTDDRDENLQMIKEQAEEEDNFRKNIQAEATKHQHETQQRKQQASQLHSQKLQLEKQAAEARRERERLIEEQAQAEREAQLEMLVKQQEESLKLRRQHAAEQQKKEQERQLQLERDKEQSRLRREEYEQQEKLRQEKIQQERLHKQIEDEHQQLMSLLQEKQDREAEIAQKLRLQEERDETDLQKNLRKVQLENEARQQMKLEISKRESALKEEMDQTIKMADTLLEGCEEVPPNVRTFNENDILGDFDRNQDGEIVVLLDTTGQHRDKAGNITNARGYLLDRSTGAVIENQNFQEMFAASVLDHTGELPAPFCWERYNFNPHLVMGDFDLTEDKKMKILSSGQGFCVDKQGRRVSKHGWLVLKDQNHLVDNQGRKKLNGHQMTGDGNIPKLYSYQGKRFDIRDVMGTFDKDQHGKILFQHSKKGKTDKLGRRVNEKGYLTDAAGNIVDQQNRQIWAKCELLDGEFPKIFPFTKFNPKKIKGDFDPQNPVMGKNASGKTVDRLKRLVNKKGYLVDERGNIIDIFGNKMLDKCVLTGDDIPPVFITEGFFTHKDESMTDLMAEIEKANHSKDLLEEPTRDGVGDRIYLLKEGETSMDSQMEDTPANYNAVNQRIDSIDRTQGTLVDEAEHDFGFVSRDVGSDNEGVKGRRKPAKKSKKQPQNTVAKVEVLPPTERDKQTAGAYGGQAVGSVRRPGIKYDKERLKGSLTFRVNTTDEARARNKINQLIKSASGSQQLASIVDSDYIKKQSQKGGTIQNSMDSGDNVEGMVQNQQRGATKEVDSIAQTQFRVGTQRNKKPLVKDFEEIFGKDIDQFLEDSDWEVNSAAQKKVSLTAKSNTEKLKELERQVKHTAQGKE